MNIELERLKQNLTAQTYRNDVSANNLANINTSGFKRDVSFVDILSDVEGGNTTIQVQTDFSQGTLKETANALDLAISGDGFFSVDGNGRELYTRDGHFSIDNEGFLTNSTGNRVMGYSGWINLAQNNGKIEDISINQLGDVYVGEKLIDTLKVVDFENYNVLQKAGGNSFSAPNSAEKLTNATILQGTLELSNVSAVKEMVGLMDIQRNFESSQRVIKSIDETLSKAANEIGRYR